MSSSSRHIIKLIILVDIILAVCILAEQKLTRADAFLYTAVARLCGQEKECKAQLHTPGAPVRVESVIRHERRRHYPSVFLLHWEADGRDDLSALPRPKLQELATIIHCLATKADIGCVGISTPLVWEDERDEMARHMLSRALQSCRFACLGLPARNAAQTEATPDQLKPAAIPHHQVEGDPTGIPYANAPLRYSSPVADKNALLWAPDYVEDAPDDGSMAQGLSCPLLLRWKGDILPTLPLRLALAQQGLTPADVHVRLGKSIRLGKRIFPIDAQGRTPLGAARVVPLLLADVLAAPPAEQGELRATAIIDRPFTPDQGTRRGRQLAATLSLLLSAESDIYLPTERPEGGLLLELNPLQSTLAGRIIIATLVICCLVWLPLLPSREQRTALGGLALAGLIAGLVWYRQGIWMSLCAWVIGWALLCGAVYLLHRSLKH